MGRTHLGAITFHHSLLQSSLQYNCLSACQRHKWATACKHANSYQILNSSLRYHTAPLLCLPCYHTAQLTDCQTHFGWDSPEKHQASPSLAHPCRMHCCQYSIRPALNSPVHLSCDCLKSIRLPCGRSCHTCSKLWLFLPQLLVQLCCLHRSGPLPRPM